MAAFGTSVLFITDEAGVGITFQTVHLSECHIGEDSRGRVNRLYREYRLTGHQAVEFFGDDTPAEIRTAMEKEPGKQFTFLHAVFPRREIRGPAGFATSMPWASIYFWMDKKQRIREGGFEEFPYLAPRWRKLPGERYGRSPSIEVMPAIKLLNVEKKTTVRAARKQVSPPLMIKEGSLVGKLDLGENGINQFRASFGGEDPVKALETGGQPALGVDMMTLEQQIIERAFFIDVLTTPLSDRMTATEILQRREEQLRQLGPILSRLLSELLSPLVDRVFALMARRSIAAWRVGRDGMLPLPPPELIANDNARIEADYVSPISTAQKTVEIEAMARVLDMTDRVLAYDPDVATTVNGEAVIRRTAKVQGAPADMLNSPEVVSAERQRRAEQRAAQAAAEQAAVEAGAVKDLAQAGQAAAPTDRRAA